MTVTRIVLLLLLVTHWLGGEVRLPAIISDNMLLQAGSHTPIWGWAEEGEQVTVRFNGRVEKTIADKDGRWQVHLKDLKPREAGTLTVTGSNELAVENVLVGEVWLCAGQSNMQFGIYALEADEQEAIRARPATDQLRFFKVFNHDVKGGPVPFEDIEGKWDLCDADTVYSMTAIGYYFAYQLNHDTGQPVGLILAAVGGSVIETFIPLEAFKVNPEMDKYVVQYGQIKEEEKPDLRQAPTYLYNGLIAGMIPYGIRGVLWYQGESNGWMGPFYEELMLLMAEAWRSAWELPALPFLIVQLPGYGDGKRVDMPQHRTPWSTLRQAQANAAERDPHMYMACTIDLGDLTDIHPKKKKPVADRLYRIAMKEVYADPRGLAYGPRLDDIVFQGPKVLLRFSDTGEGLRDRNGGALKGFAIGDGEEGQLHWATAKIIGDNVVELASPEVSQAQVVSYAWAMYPECDLVNSEGLPAYPFFIARE